MVSDQFFFVGIRGLELTIILYPMITGPLGDDWRPHLKMGPKELESDEEGVAWDSDSHKESHKEPREPENAVRVYTFIIY